MLCKGYKQMDYKTKKLASNLIFIKWYRTPPLNSPVVDQFTRELELILEKADQPVYFISDLRKGRIIDMRAIRRLGDLTRHKNWGGSTAFSKEPISAIFVRSFQKFSGQITSRDTMHTTPEEAFGFLEALKPGITQDLDWSDIASVS